MGAGWDVISQEVLAAAARSAKIAEGIAKLKKSGYYSLLEMALLLAEHTGADSFLLLRNVRLYYWPWPVLTADKWRFFPLFTSVHMDLHDRQGNLLWQGYSVVRADELVDAEVKVNLGNHVIMAFNRHWYFAFGDITANPTTFAPTYLDVNRQLVSTAVTRLVKAMPVE
jgi:hypothetical protein